MSNRTDIRDAILRKLMAAKTLLPAEVQPRLPPNSQSAGEPDWYPWEHKVWEIGEEIRQLLKQAPGLRSDEDLALQFLEISRDNRAGRGRQSFIMLLGFKTCEPLAKDLVSELGDQDVRGHVIWALYRMRAKGFSKLVEGFRDDNRAWIRKEARRYVAWDDNV